MFMKNRMECVRTFGNSMRFFLLNCAINNKMKDKGILKIGRIIYEGIKRY